MGAGARATHPSDRKTWPRSTRRTMEGSIAWIWKKRGWRSGVCVCLRATAGSTPGQARNVFAKGTRNVFGKGIEGMCAERDKGRDVFGKGQRKRYDPFLTRVRKCKGTDGKVFANVNVNVNANVNEM